MLLSCRHQDQFNKQTEVFCNDCRSGCIGHNLVHNILINFHDWNHSNHFNNHLIFYRNFDVLLLRIRQVSSFYPQQEHCVRKIALRRHVKNAGLILLRRDNLVLMGMEGPSWERQGWWQAYQLRSRSKADLNPTSLLTERPVNLDKHISALPSSRHRPTVPLLRAMMPRRRRRPMPRQRRRLPASPASVALRLEKNEACMRVFHEFARDLTCAEHWGARFA